MSVLIAQKIFERRSLVSQFVVTQLSAWHLRQRVAQNDLLYFYDIAVPNPDKRKNLNNADDLVKIDDSELIHGAKEIGLLSDIGFMHLDYIRYMRNWISAAHPNQNEIRIRSITWHLDFLGFIRDQTLLKRPDKIYIGFCHF